MAHIEPQHIPFSTELDTKFPVYIVEPSTRDEGITTTISRVKKARYPYRSFHGEDDLRMSAPETTRHVAAASGIILPFQDPALPSAVEHNIRCMFVAGLAEGMNKPTLMLAPTNFEAPLDIRDKITPYKTANDIANDIADFCPLIVEYSSQIEPSGIDTQTLLEALSIGDPRAENEMPTLDLYYLKTDQFERTVRGEANLVVGRKGSASGRMRTSIEQRSADGVLARPFSMLPFQNGPRRNHRVDRGGLFGRCCPAGGTNAAVGAVLLGYHWRVLP